jgi:hypothetical protein
MSVRRYAVANKDGKIVNHILVEDPLPKGYWPGYGAYLLPLEPVDTSNGGGGLDLIKFDKLSVLPQIGDVIDLDTGTVTKFVSQIITQKVGGADIQVASAPSVKLETDFAPKSEGTVTTKADGVK